MFSGIVEELGRVVSLERAGGGARLHLEARVACAGTRVGDSISVNGVCLTVVSRSDTALSFDLLAETLRCTNLGSVRRGERVNLERALQVGERVSGHFVTGHIDCVGTVRRTWIQQGGRAFEIACASRIPAPLVPKGSLAVDGISLTVAALRGAVVTVYIIAHTARETTLGFKQASSRVNIEFDILAKRPT